MAVTALRASRTNQKIRAARLPPPSCQCCNCCVRWQSALRDVVTKCDPVIPVTRFSSPSDRQAHSAGLSTKTGPPSRRIHRIAKTNPAAPCTTGSGEQHTTLRTRYARAAAHRVKRHHATRATSANAQIVRHVALRDTAPGCVHARHRWHPAKIRDGRRRVFVDDDFISERFGHLILTQHFIFAWVPRTYAIPPRRERWPYYIQIVKEILPDALACRR